MATHRHLANAPITEAIIDLRVRMPSDFDPSIFSSLKEDLQDRYPHAFPLKIAKWDLAIEDDKAVQTVVDEGRLFGYRFESDDKKNVAQFRSDGFTFSRLKPYTDWEHVIHEARGLWSLYATIASPESVVRIATRYINRLDIPLPIHDFSHYLTSPPQLPQSLPQCVSSFLTRIVIRDPQFDIAANIIQAFEPNVEATNYVIMIVDIDAYKAVDFSPDEPRMWDDFARLRDMKNRIFFESITEDAARLFE